MTVPSSETTRPIGSWSPEPRSALDARDHRLELDGLRGLAVAAVLAFHLDLPWAVGGYLGVSTFFSLSGFLITRVLLARDEASPDGDSGDAVPNLARFWRRRVRRLLPAATLTLAGVATLVATGELTGGPRPVGDLVAAAAQVSNWWFLSGPDSYADLFAEPSPVLHHWSLAIEEQIYLVLPIVVWTVFRLAPSPVAAIRRLRLVLLLGLTVAAQASLTAGDLDTVYYSTHIRAGEVLLGSLAATFAWSWPAPRDRGETDAHSGSERLIAAAGVVALAVTLWCWTAVDLTDPVVRRGGLLAFGVVSTTLVVTALRPGLLRRVLRLRALVALGAISYGTYLVHWPVYLWTDERFPDAAPAFDAAVKVGISLVLATLSARLVERPVRAGRAGVVRTLSGALVVAIVVVALAGVLPSRPDRDDVDIDAAAARLEALIDRTSSGTGADDPDPDTVRIAFYGDSTALVLGLGVRDQLAGDPTATVVPGTATLGCGIVRGDERRTADRTSRLPEECRDWPDRWTAVLRQHPTDVAVVLVGPFDVLDRRIGGAPTWFEPGDPTYDQLALAEIRRAIEVLSKGARHVVFLTSPRLGTAPRQLPSGPDAVVREAGRMDRFNELLRAAAGGSEVTTVIDFATWMQERVDDGADTDLRPHGVHLSDQGTAEAGAWLVPQLVTLVDEG